jgi:hypothetical protein
VSHGLAMAILPPMAQLSCIAAYAKVWDAQGNLAGIMRHGRFFPAGGFRVHYARAHGHPDLVVRKKRRLTVRLHRDGSLHLPANAGRCQASR